MAAPAEPVAHDGETERGGFGTQIVFNERYVWN